MSLSVPSRRLLRGAPALAATPTTTTTTTSSLLPALQSLTLSSSSNTTTANHPSATRGIHTTPANRWFWNREKKDQAPPMERELSGSQESRRKLMAQLNKPLEGPAIFEDEYSEAASKVNQTSGGGDGSGGGGGANLASTGASLAREHLARSADPDPRARIRWERKMVIRQVHNATNPFSREPRAARIARTERQLTSKSPNMATSTKKLVHLARQIQGKTVAEALVQMRFSKKKYAQEVRLHLEEARDLAVVERGMGLGGKKKKAAAAAAADAAAAAAPVLADVAASSSSSSSSSEAVEILTKDGKWIKVDDPTRMYVAEAWVNRGSLRGKMPEYRARGRMNILKLRAASISVVLKEEKTRIREAAERQAKKLRQGPWVHLPNRPVSAQRQWYSW